MERRIDLQIMRIIAIIFVITNHTATNEHVSRAIYHSGGASYYVYLFIAAFSRVAVPLFFMISGTLLSAKQEPISTIWKKRIRKHIAVIIVFSLINIVIMLSQGYIVFSRENVLSWLVDIYSSSVIVPYWFLYAYLSLLMMLPFLRKLASNLNKKEFEYLIILHLIIFGVLQVVEFFVGLERINLDIPLACSAPIFYFLLGYYIDVHVEVSKKRILLLWGATIIASALLTFMVYCQIAREGVFEQGALYNYSSSLIIVPTVALFVTIKRLCEKYSNVINKKIKKILDFAGNTAFGIYLLEIVFKLVTFDIYFVVLKCLPPILAWGGMDCRRVSRRGTFCWRGESIDISHKD